MSEQPPSPANEAQPLTRVRITFGKVDTMRYVGNLDMHTVWERTLRRAGLPLAYSKGFKPRPRFQMAASLPLGATSRVELLDVWLEGEIAPDELRGRLERAAPPGLLIVTMEEVPLQSPAMQTRLLAAEYVVPLREAMPRADLEQRVDALRAAESLPRTWRGKAYDLRPLIETIAVGEDEPLRLLLRLTAREGATGRPEEVLAALGLDPLSGSVERVGLIY